MSVDLDTTDAPANEDTAPAERTSRPRSKRDTPPSRSLTLVCERCDKPIRGSGAGFAYVSLVGAQKVAQRATAGYIDPAKARWTLAHRDCAPEVLAPMSPYFRLWAERIGTADELLDAMAELSRLPWLASSEWGGFVRRVLYDSDTSAAERATAARRRAERAAAMAPDDPRHGTTNGYRNCVCRCDACRAAESEDHRAKKALSATESDEQGAVV